MYAQNIYHHAAYSAPTLSGMAYNVSASVRENSLPALDTSAGAAGQNARLIYFASDLMLETPIRVV
jgi:hypothetical protein